ncbi:2-C-methyl-D-erythritol 4-phosphate cytidylyltransferase [Shimia sp. R9_2]|uniref:IspD/TarI family cytidylyltransferase n=1 Tax=Shimia sp. R9_2 TaxID=2821112 RepID=UPI001ADC983E|nr:2-C-methyl-D-erythritol 4-phosphate cytidylyltransferase [Shimia sp. R9_2]MBO9398951.1 2-C-methyl-D-erythritol 4-phosphate cytidylyltransferase [Shimia sp. R9_2]
MNLHPLTRPLCTPRVSFLLLSGGVGARAEHHEPKQFYKLAGHPMVAHSLIAAVRSPHVAEVLINAPEGFEERTQQLMEAYCGRLPFQVVPAGATRQESCAALAAAASHDVVVLHEAARPFINPEMLSDLIACEAENAGYCHAIAFSMCRIDTETRQVRRGVSRDRVFDIQLPQKFDRATLQKAHVAARNTGAVYNEDSVMVVEMTGQPVQALEGFSRNRKVTTPEDFVIAQEMMKGFHSNRKAAAHD